LAGGPPLPRGQAFGKAHEGENIGFGLAVANPTPIVFVVDDDVSVGESLEALISTEGWRAECFASARDFLAHPRAGTPSCLILDVSLPDLNGLDLQKQLAGERLDMPIIFITGVWRHPHGGARHEGWRGRVPD